MRRGQLLANAALFLRVHRNSYLSGGSKNQNLPKIFKLKKYQKSQEIPSKFKDSAFSMSQMANLLKLSIEVLPIIYPFISSNIFVNPHPPILILLPCPKVQKRMRVSHLIADYQYSKQSYLLRQMNLLEHLRKCKQPNNTPSKNSVSTRLPSVLPASHHKETTLKRSPTKSSASPKSFSKYGRWDDLPPIYELRRTRILDLEERKSEIIENLLISKHEAAPDKSQSHRNKTQMAAYKKKYMLSHRCSVPINFQEVRMKPIDKYYKRLDNIRIAERLLTIKPSPSLNRDSLKKFYLQQKNYRSQLSRNCDLLKMRSKKRSTKILKEWLF